MNFKLPVFIALNIFFSIFILSTASAALTINDQWADGSTSAVIQDGQSIDFYPYFFTMESSMNIKIELLDSQSKVVHTFLNTPVNCGTVCDMEYSYTLDKGIYLNAGTFSIIAQGTDGVGSSQSSEITLKVNPVIPADTTAPVITLKGANPQIIIKGNPYTELGASATDNVDGDISSKITIDFSSVNVNVVGDYTVSYNVKDAAGNSATTVTRTIRVVSNPVNPTDTTAPVITLISPENKEYTTNKITFKITTDENATAEFSIDGGSRVAMANPFDDTFTYTLSGISNGNHTIVFYAKDASNNEANKTIDFSVNHKSSSGSGGGMGIVPQSTTISIPKITSTSSEVSGIIISGHKESALDEAPLYLILVITGLGIVIAGLVLVRRLRKII